MLEFELKRKFKKRIYSKFTLVVLIVVLGLVLNGTYKIFKKQMIVKKDLRETTAILDDYQERKEKLQKNIEEVDSIVGQEEILRENYYLAKDGEHAIFIIDSDEEEPEIVPQKNFMQKIGGFFGGLFN